MKTTKQITINNPGEIILPSWKKDSKQYREAKALRDLADASGYPYTYTIEVEVESAADIELDF